MIYGSSTSNQQIEAWWSQFRRAKGTWWINFFKDLINSNVYDNSINYHVEIMRPCFMFIIQQELDEMKSMVRNALQVDLFFILWQSNQEEKVSDFLSMKWI